MQLLDITIMQVCLESWLGHPPWRGDGGLDSSLLLQFWHIGVDNDHPISESWKDHLIKVHCHIKAPDMFLFIIMTGHNILYDSWSMASHEVWYRFGREIITSIKRAKTLSNVGHLMSFQYRVSTCEVTMMIAHLTPNLQSWIPLDIAQTSPNIVT